LGGGKGRGEKKEGGGRAILRNFLTCFFPGGNVCPRGHTTKKRERGKGKKKGEKVLSKSTAMLLHR